MAYKRLGEILTDAGVISEEQLGKALALGREQNKRLGEVLIDNKIITERQLIDVLKLQLGVDFIDLTKVDIPVQMAQLLPKNIARKHEVVPVRATGDTLYLAMSDPSEFHGNRRSQIGDEETCHTDDCHEECNEQSHPCALRTRERKPCYRRNAEVNDC
jgi:hypothetical protein